MRAFYALFVARNKEFLRDRGTLAWNFLFPFLIVVVLALVFSGSGRHLYKVGIVGAGEDGADSAVESGSETLRAFLQTRYVQFVPIADEAAAQEKVRHHQIDMVLRPGAPPRYWINASNPKGYFLERVLWGSGAGNGFLREVLEGREIRYVDWLLPGVLAMNMMFSCLWGVGYVVVRYRKGGMLRRLKAAPITAFQFIAAQIASRLVLVMFVTAVVYFGTDAILDFYRVGTLAALFLMFAVGAVCLIALGVLIASRTHSQELAGGLLNLATWPMMFLSGVWFSLEGSNPWLERLALIFPLTHLINGARKIMVDGATLLGVLPELAVLVAMTAVFLAAGSALFRWE